MLLSGAKKPKPYNHMYQANYFLYRESHNEPWSILLALNGSVHLSTVSIQNATKNQIAWLRLLSKKLARYFKDEKKNIMTGASKSKDKRSGGKVLEKPEKLV